MFVQIICTALSLASNLLNYVNVELCICTSNAFWSYDFLSNRKRVVRRKCDGRFTLMSLKHYSAYSILYSNELCYNSMATPYSYSRNIYLFTHTNRKCAHTHTHIYVSLFRWYNCKQITNMFPVMCSAARIFLWIPHASAALQLASFVRRFTLF